MNCSLARATLLIIVIALSGLVISLPARADLPPVVPVYSGVTPLSEIGLYDMSYRYDSGVTGSEPVGWSGMFDQNTGISALVYGRQNGKEAYLLHPIWHGGIGDTDQTYRLRLPPGAKVTLSFGIAMQTAAAAPGKSDGVTFRLDIDGKRVLDQNKTDDAWSEYSFNLSADAGKIVTLQFEADPGPRRNASFDFGFWGDRSITVVGGPAMPPPMAASAANLTALDTFTKGWGSASPTYSSSAPASPIRLKVEGPVAGMLSGCSFQPGGSAIPFGEDARLTLVAPDGRQVDSSDPNVLLSGTQMAALNGGIMRTVKYSIGGRTVMLNETISPYDGASVRVHLSSADPYVAALNVGMIGPTAYRKVITVPYLGSIDFDPQHRLFYSVSIDYALSHASRLDDNTAYYNPLTNGHRNTLDETIYYAVSPDVESVLPTPIGQHSPYRAEMGSRIVFDSWNSHLDSIRRQLDLYASYGVKDLYVIVHNWQHAGYDNGLPDVLPVNLGVGGNDAMTTLTKTARGYGERLALHENYVDFYPNAESWTPSDVSLAPDGTMQKAWLNKIQSFQMTPSAMHKYASRTTTEVHRQLGTNGSYLDVHSAIPPWDHVDYRPSTPDAGSFYECLTAQHDLWQYMRDVHGGPVTGEGSHHWFWSGMLDGVEAQFGAGIPSNAGPGASLFVDFDLTKVHPRQINHGMGYIERWLPDDVRDDRPTVDQRDEYRMQEIAYGHAGFAGNLMTNNLGFVFQEANLVLPVTRSYAMSDVTSVQYDVGGAMLDTNRAIASGTSFDRVRVTYANGTNVWANDRDELWGVKSGKGTVNLPKHGWLVSGPGLLAYTGGISGRTVDYAETPTSIFANARTMPANIEGVESSLDVTPMVESLTPTGPRRFQIEFAWEVGQPIQAGSLVFVHVTSASVTENEGIVYQFNSGIADAPVTWPVGKTTKGSPVTVQLPPGLAPGTYTIKVGLYGSSGGVRVSLKGNDDGSRRYAVAQFTIHPDGSINDETTASTGITSAIPSTDVIDFGKAATNGCISLTRQAPGRWTLIPCPRDVAFDVRLESPLVKPCQTVPKVTAFSVSGTNLGLVATRKVSTAAGSGAEFTVNVIPAAAYYQISGLP